MSEKSKIAWTDATFNPWWGCTKVSPGCDNCYAEAWDKRTGGFHWGKNQPRRTFGDKHWREPLKWDMEAGRTGRRTKVFCASMADVMDDEAPEGQRERLWQLIDSTPSLDWLLLTKRPHRYGRYLPTAFKHGNVWLGTSAENQQFYDVRWPILADVAGMRNLPAWVSYEPALGPLTMHESECGVPDWIIFGGESGSNRRPIDRAWADSLLQECRELGVAFFMKQMSARTPEEGAQIIPAELLVREYPR